MFGFFLLGGRILKRMKCTERPLRVVMMELSPPNQVILELFHNVISDGRGGGGYWTMVQEVAMSDWAGSFYCVLCKVYQYSGCMVTTYNTL